MHHHKSHLCGRIAVGGAATIVLAVIGLLAAPQLAHSWTESDFENRPLVAYPVPTGRDDLIGSLQTYTIRRGDTLLDVARWYGLSPTEVSNANNHMDWWTPPVGKLIIIPTEHILPYAPRLGIVMNIPEMRLYYYYPTPVGGHPHHARAKFTHTAYGGTRNSAARRARKHPIGGVHPTIIYTFPVGLGRYDWRTPTGAWTVRSKTHNPTWVVPEDIYQEHLERDGEAEHVVEGGDPDNPLGHYRLSLTLPMYALHGTNVPWGVGMEVSHGCVRLYPEDIDRLYHRTSVGTPGRFVYQPVKFGWRGGLLYVEVHEDLYGVYPGLWRHALSMAKARGLLPDIDMLKLERAVEEKTGVPTYVMPGPEPPSAMPPATETASSVPLPPPGSAATAPDADTGAVSGADSGAVSSGSPASAESDSDADGTEDAADRAATAAIPAAPATDAIRPAAAAASAASDNEASDDGERDASAAAGGSASAASAAPAAPASAPAEDDSSQWHRLPPGALPVE